MGNSTSLPLLAQDRILSYLELDEAKNLALANKSLYEQVMSNRPFWCSQARQLYVRDPCIFVRLRSPARFEQDVLVKLVSRAHSQFQEIESKIVTNTGNEKWIWFSHRILSIAVDETNARVAVFLDNRDFLVYSLSRFGDDPIVVYALPEVSSMVLHDRFVFFRPSQNMAEHNADVVDWENGFHMPSLSPGVHIADPWPYKKSEDYLVFYHSATSKILAYPLAKDKYDTEFRSVSLPAGTELEDYATNKSSVLAIFAQSGAYYYGRFDIESSQMFNKFLVASPTGTNSPKIVYPNILVNLTPTTRRTLGGRETARYIIMGARSFIPSPNPITTMTDRVLASGILADPASAPQFVFVTDVYDRRSRIIYVGNHRYFGELGIAYSDPEYVMASFGLSYLFARSNLLMLRYFYDARDVDIAL